MPSGMKPDIVNKAVILAAGLGSRMRKSDAVNLSPEQDSAAGTGIKAMIPLAGKRPFLDYILTELADAGFEKICIIIGPGAEFNMLKEYYTALKPERINICYAVQNEPKGTANAVSSAEKFADGDHFIMINSDNLYPAKALRMLREINCSATAAFESDALVKHGNISADKISKFAVLEPDENMNLRRIVEKPSDEYMKKLGKNIYVSMNCWRFSPLIFEACRNIKPSVRGEYEIASAVSYAIENLHESFKMMPVALPVLDMTGRSDITILESLLKNSEVRL